MCMWMAPYLAISTSLYRSPRVDETWLHLICPDQIRKANLSGISDLGSQEHNSGIRDCPAPIRYWILMERRSYYFEYEGG